MASQREQKVSKEDFKKAEEQIQAQSGLKNSANASLLHFKSERSFSFKKLGGFLAVVWTNIKQHPLIFFAMAFSTIANGIMATIMPLIASNIVNAATLSKAEAAAIGTDPFSFLGMTMSWISWVYVMIFALVVMVIFEFLTDYLIGVFAMKVEVQQRLEILDKLVDQDTDFFFNHPTGVILTRLVADTQGLALGIQMFISNLIYAISAVTSSIVILFTRVAPHATLLAGIAVAYTAVVCLIAFGIFVFFRRALIRMFDIKREIDANITDRISNITLIKSSGQELQEIKRNEMQNAVYNKAGNSSVLLQVVLNLWIYITSSFLPTIITIIAISLSKHSGDMLGLSSLLTLFIPDVNMLALPIVMMVTTLRAATRASNSADRISQLTGPKPTILPNPRGPKIDKINDIKFDKVAFAYPQDPTNEIIPPTDFHFEKGKSYAFVGETGSGKSTIGRLLMRMYDPSKGEVIINDKYNLKDVNLPDYLQHVGYVEQNPQIFYGDFWENIAYGTKGKTKKQIIAAAKKADLHDFIMSLPDGYDTILGERGFLLSGGQKQRLVIARIFLKDPDLVILDEATSALDNIVEQEIQVQLDKLVEGKTSVTIAHRLSTIKNVDEVVVITPKKGITQVGTFDKLKKVPGHFKDLYEAGLMD